MRRLAAFLVIGLFACAAPQAPPIKESECAARVARSPTLNAAALYHAVNICFGEQRELDGTFLLVAAQVRAMADMNLLRPASDADDRKVAELYGFLYFRGGSGGPASVYRDPASNKALFESLEAWQPGFAPGYDPGWKYKPSSRIDLYGHAIRYQKLVRIAQLRHYSALINDDAYFAARRELDEIQQRNPRAIPIQSPDGQRAGELTRIMNEVGRRTPPAPMPRYEGSLRHLYEPDPDAPFKQVFSGFNGPDSAMAGILERAADVRASWIGRALSASELDAILAPVDFSRQIVVVLAMGRAETANGDVIIRDVKYQAEGGSLTVSGALPVNDQSCTQGRALSRPFAIAIAPRPARLPDRPGFSMSSFADGCKLARSGDAARAN